MKEIFSHGTFASDKIQDSRYNILLNESRTFSNSTQIKAKTTVFISHKHKDLEDLKGFIGYLEKYYNVRCYIDSEDSNMPTVTSAKTAERIREIIKETDRFILLATDSAIASKWCNWELGYADQLKYNDNRIAILPMSSNKDTYKGSEYMQIYPRIVYIDDNDIVSNQNLRLYYPERPLQAGYYILSIGANGKECYKDLHSWLH